jgi:hypothetical protein
MRPASFLLRFPAGSLGFDTPVLQEAKDLFDELSS